MSFEVNGEVKQLRGTLVNVSADNPAACLLGGFKQLHSAFRKCRFCMAVDTDMQTKVGHPYSCYELQFSKAYFTNSLVQREIFPVEES